MDYYENSQFAEAIEIFKNVLNEAPYDAQARLYLNRSQEGLSKINIAHEIQDGIREGDKLFAEKQYEKALTNSGRPAP